MRFEQLPKRIDPFVGVLTGFAHPYRDIVFVTEGKILLDRLLIYRHPVLVKSVDELPIKGWSKYLEVGIPLRAPQKDNVIPVHLSYARNDLAVERLQLWVQRRSIEIVCNWLVE